jgi:hypothetical protein
MSVSLNIALFTVKPINSSKSGKEAEEVKEARFRLDISLVITLR